jgi:hypothetical protein
VFACQNYILIERNQVVAVTYPLVDEHGNDKAYDQEDNDEDDNDTRLTLSEVLASLDQLVDGELAASSNERHINGGHCKRRFCK